MRRSMQNEVQSVQSNLIVQLEDYGHYVMEAAKAPKVGDFGSDTLTRLQQVKSSNFICTYHKNIKKRGDLRNSLVLLGVTTPHSFRFSKS